MAYFITASASSSVVQTTFDTTGSIVTSSLFTPNDPLNVDNITTIKKSRSPYPNLNRPIYKESVSFTNCAGIAVDWLYDNTASRDSDFNLIKALNTNYESSGGGGSWVGTATSDLNMATYTIYGVANITSSGNISSSASSTASFGTYVGDGSQLTGVINTGSFATTGSNVFSGSQIITGSLTLHNVGSSSPTLNFENDGTSTPLSQIKGQSYGSGVGGGLDFYYYDGSHKEGFQLNNLGNVGIGTSSPPQRLTVSGSISASGAIVGSSFSGDGSELTNLQRPISLSVSSHMTASNDNAGFFFEVGAVTCSIQTKASVTCDVGSEFEFFQSSSGNFIFVTGSGVTLRSKGGALTLTGQYSGATLKQIRDDEWVLVGDLA